LFNRLSFIIEFISVPYISQHGGSTWCVLVSAFNVFIQRFLLLVISMTVTVWRFPEIIWWLGILILILLV